MFCTRLMPCCKVRSRTFCQFLLVLCGVSLFGLLVTQKNRIITTIYPRLSGERSFKDLEAQIHEEDDSYEFGLIEELLTTSSTPPPTTVVSSKTKTLLKIAANSVNFTTKPKELTTKRTWTSTKEPSKLIKALTSKGPLSVGTMRNMNVTSLSFRPQLSTQKVISTTYNFGDEYATDDMHLHSNCPNRTRDHFQNSKDLKKLYLETIPVLQWKKHAQESEYERLRKYAGAQGWMGVTWPILNETLNLMNSTGNGYMFDTWNGDSPCIRCAVVGNGGILNGSRMGKEIDSHDYVFRVNGAITNGFEEDVGNRTSFYFFSTNTLMNSFAAYGKRGFRSIPRTKETRFVLLPDHDRDYLIVRAALTDSIIDRGRDKNKDPARYFGKNLTTEHFKILHPDFMRYLRNRFLWAPILNTKNRDIYRPSTGASILLAAIHTCDQLNKIHIRSRDPQCCKAEMLTKLPVTTRGFLKLQREQFGRVEQVSAYGFMTPNYANFSDHYYDQTYHRVAFYANHHYRKEMSLWQELHKAGVITLYMRD